VGCIGKVDLISGMFGVVSNSGKPLGISGKSVGRSEKTVRTFAKSV
jgi:hypothetical protein